MKTFITLISSCYLNEVMMIMMFFIKKINVLVHLFDSFQLGNIERMLSQVPRLSLMCIMILTKPILKMIIDQILVLYF